MTRHDHFSPSDTLRLPFRTFRKPRGGEVGCPYRYETDLRGRAYLVACKDIKWRFSHCEGCKEAKNGEAEA